MSSRLIVLDKIPGVRTVGVCETWRHIFAMCVLRVMGPKATNACKDDHLCAGLKVGINRAVHGDQAIWGTKLSTEDCVFLLLDTNNSFNDINRIVMLWTVRHVWPSGYFFKLLSSMVIACLSEREWYSQFYA